MPKKKNIPQTPTDWIYAKYNDYEYHMKKNREREHKLFKREFINAFLAEQERRKNDSLRGYNEDKRSEDSDS